MRHASKHLRGAAAVPEYTVGSGNVFADLGRPDAEEALLKAELARRISGIIRDRQLTQTEAAELLEIDQPKVSKLKRGQLTGFSTDRLLRFLLALGADVEIVIAERPQEQGRRGRLLVAAGHAKQQQAA